MNNDTTEIAQLLKKTSITDSSYLKEIDVLEKENFKLMKAQDATHTLISKVIELLEVPHQDQEGAEDKLDFIHNYLNIVLEVSSKHVA